MFYAFIRDPINHTVGTLVCADSWSRVEMLAANSGIKHQWYGTSNIISMAEHLYEAKPLGVDPATPTSLRELITNMRPLTSDGITRIPFDPEHNTNSFMSFNLGN